MEFLGLQYRLPISIESVTNETVHEAINGQKFAIRKPYQYWRFIIGLEPRRITEGENIFGRLLAHRAEFQLGGTFQIQVPQPILCSPSTIATGQIRGSNNNYTLSSDLAVNSGCLEIGRFITIGTNAGGKLYMIKTSQANANVGGQATRRVSLYPSLETTLSAGAVFHYNQVIMNARYAETGDASISVNIRGVVQETITIEEAL